MHKIVKIILVVIGVVGLILWFMLPDGDMPAGEAAQSGAMNAMFIITYILLGIAAIASLLFGLVNLFSNPNNIKKSLFVIGGLLVVAAISYAMASGTGVADNYQAMASETAIKRIHMGLNVFFILVIVAVLAMLWGGVRKMTK